VKLRRVELNDTPSQNYMGSPDTSKHIRLNPNQRPVLDLATPEGWKAELS